MNLIINKKIPMFKKGYPTVSDKYNVSGAILSGNAPVQFGGIVVKDTQTPEGNYFKAPGTSIASVANIGGFVLATNVKLVQDWPGTTVQVNPGEAFNLVVGGNTYMAVELDPNIITAEEESAIVANSAVAIYLSGASVAQLTYHGAQSADSVTATDLPNVVFTGLYEINNGKLLAEILVK